jgi:hypothetical protein
VYCHVQVCVLKREERKQQRVQHLSHQSWTAASTFNISLAYLKLRASEKFRLAKEKWDGDPAHERTEEIPPPPPKKSCLDQARNALARTTQIRTGQLAVYCVPQ